MGKHCNLVVLDDAWMDRANCTGIEPSVFFDPSNEPEAKQVCAGCEVRAECLDAAFTLGARDGIWGGLRFDERKRLRRAEQRAARNAR